MIRRRCGHSDYSRTLFGCEIISPWIATYIQLSHLGNPVISPNITGVYLILCSLILLPTTVEITLNASTLDTHQMYVGIQKVSLINQNSHYGCH